MEEDSNLLGHLLFIGSKIASENQIIGELLLIQEKNLGKLFFFTYSFLAGRKMDWPPG